MGGYLLNVIHCANTRKIMRTALDKGWEWVGYTKSGHIEIRWPATGALIHCATTPSDPNSWKAFAREVTKVSGVEVWRKGNKRRSRKPANRPDLQVEASRRRHAEQGRAAVEREREQHLAARRRQAAIEAAAESERRRRDIEFLMRPGFGH